MNLKIKLNKKLRTVFGGKKEHDEILTEIEELLITADFGIDFTALIIDNLKTISVSYEQEEITGHLKNIIMKEMAFDLQPDNRQAVPDNVLNAHLIFGVNGTGKTTTVGKLAYKLKNDGNRVLIAAADTYRDAAIDQLMIWSNRADVPVILKEQGSDSGAVVYDACDASKRRSIDDLIIDTAGRLHNKEALMEELSKISRILEKRLPEARKLKMLVLDATTGQNAISQAVLFNQYVGVDGIILTKLDSSSKGGVACAVSGKLKIPIFYAGTGESLEDLVDFNVEEYLDTIFTQE
ncbi:MAG TPA: signal recognition particle-docking protein FtsY [Spirochaetes bacterium]|nr:signal recognition particle-docking protein FtsY [Spirochaetota bacterium]